MPSSHEGLNELAVLMELRLAFGPGTRLWTHRSREEICYDWLHFKARKLDASFRDFAIRLYLAEKRQSLPGVSLHEIRRRVAIVLKAYRIKKRAAIARVPTPTPPVEATEAKPNRPPPARCDGNDSGPGQPGGAAESERIFTPIKRGASLNPVAQRGTRLSH